MKNGNVVIWHIGRCGSTVLSSVLNQHPNINCLGEVFNPLMDTNELGKDVPDFDSFFSNLINHEPSKIRILEVKFLESQHLSVYNMTLPNLINKFKEIGYDRFIILERTNYLKRMVSHCVGQETKIYHLKKDETPKLHRINMDVESIKVGVATNPFIEWLRIFKNEYIQLRSYMVAANFIELQFEEDIQVDVKKAYDKVCAFLNIESSIINIPYTRTNPFHVKDMLININEVESVLSNTEFLWMLKD